MGSSGVMSHMVISNSYAVVSSLYANTLTLLNTNLLVTSGVLSVGAMHSVVMKTNSLSNSLLLMVVGLGTLFLMVQCCEYLHLY